ncbi:hypothetical protein BS78_01G038300 [Paspalum vaginatum]|nr:hypothetical protein BS78_01G038300 [Paspalum vaginatum]
MGDGRHGDGVAAASTLRAYWASLFWMDVPGPEEEGLLPFQNFWTLACLQCLRWQATKARILAAATAELSTFPLATVPKGETEAIHGAAPVLPALLRVRRPPWCRWGRGAADPVADVHIPPPSLALHMVGTRVPMPVDSAGLFCVSFSSDGAFGVVSSGEVSSKSLLGCGSRGAASTTSWRCVCLCLCAIQVEIWASPFLFGSSSWVFSPASADVVHKLEKSGLCLVPTCFGGFLLLRGVPSSGEPGLLLVFETPDSSSPVDAMAGGHLQPGRSAISVSVHVDVFEVLFMEAIKNREVSSSGRRSASSVSLLRPPVTGTTGSLQGLECIFLFI